MTDSLARLRTAGVSVWLDDLSRERLTTGSLAALRDRGVSGRIAHDTERTVAEARALWWLADRPNLFVKIPAARQGLRSARCGLPPA
jgi:transaldolase